MAHVEKRGPRRYRARYRTPDGRERSKTFERKSDAERWLAGVEVEKARGTWVDSQAGRITFGQWFSDWIASASLRPKTGDLYRYLHRRFLSAQFDAVELSKIGPTDIRRWHALALAEDVSPNTVAKAYRLLSRVLGQAVTDGVLGRNPCTLAGAGAERAPEMQHASAEQIRAIADTVPSQYRALVLIAGFGGLRWGELAGLRVRRVDILHRTVTVAEQVNEVNGVLSVGPPKSDAGRRVVALPESVARALDHHLGEYAAAGPDGLVFPDATGGPLRRSNFSRRVWVPTTTALGMEGFRFHDLRHSAGTLAAVAGATTRELMARLGHASPRAALIYQHATAERDAALADKIETLAASSRPEPTGDHVAEVLGLDRSQVGSGVSRGGDDGNRTHDPLLAKQVL